QGVDQKGLIMVGGFQVEGGRRGLAQTVQLLQGGAQLLGGHGFVAGGPALDEAADDARSEPRRAVQHSAKGLDAPGADTLIRAAEGQAVTVGKSAGSDHGQPKSEAFQRLFQPDRVGLGEVQQIHLDAVEAGIFQQFERIQKFRAVQGLRGCQLDAEGIGVAFCVHGKYLLWWIHGKAAGRARTRLSAGN
ncbi:hypothetical protein CLOSTASPAR_01353, partial [[Clostridium] asparagiforme DSM 15981]